MLLKNQKNGSQLSTDLVDRIKFEPDFISLKRFGFSIKKLKERYPEGVPDHISAQALDLDPQEFQEQYREIVEKLKIEMGVT
jgi:hypothetical protein